MQQTVYRLVECWLTEEILPVFLVKELLFDQGPRIELVLVPVPVKPMIHPEGMTGTAPDRPVAHPDAAAFYDGWGDIVGGIGSYPVLGNPHYHQSTDLLDTINHEQVAATAVAVAWALRAATAG